MIKQNIKKALAGLLVVPLAMLSVAVVSTPAFAADTDCPQGTQPGASDLTLDGGAKCAKGNSQDSSLTNVFKTVTNILLFLVGAVAVIMLVIGGLRYVTSNGDQNAVTGAKNTIMYAIIGIVVAFLAYAAVGFVTNQLESNKSTSYQKTSIVA